MSALKRPRLLLPTIMSTLLGSNLLNMIDNAIYNSNIVSTIQNSSENIKLIGTHDGSFHCDEALAVGLLKLLPEYRDATIVRTRNPEILEKCNIVVDVGAKYDPESHRYDHHQREFTGVLDGYNTKLSSAGLIYKHFGHAILREVFSTSDSPEPVTDSFVEIAYQSLYKNFMEHIDAIDNGVTISDGPLKYRISSTLSNRVGQLNPNWNEPQTPEIMNTRFMDAMSLTCSEFVIHACELSKVWWPARSIVQKAVDNRHSIHPSGKIIVLEQFCPWKEHLFDIEVASKVEPILYALYEDAGGSWRIQAVPQDPSSFFSRKKLPDHLCGLRDNVLSEKVGIPGCIFIHASGFIGGCATREGALDLAIKSLEL